MKLQTSRQIRMEHFQTFIEQIGLHKLSIQSGLNRDYLNQIKSGRRPFSYKSARKFESNLNLPIGYLDTPVDYLKQLNFEYRLPD